MNQEEAERILAIMGTDTYLASELCDKIGWPESMDRMTKRNRTWKKLDMLWKMGLAEKLPDPSDRKIVHYRAAVK